MAEGDQDGGYVRVPYRKMKRFPVSLHLSMAQEMLDAVHELERTSGLPRSELLREMIAAGMPIVRKRVQGT